MPDQLTAEGLRRLHEVAAGHVGDDRIPGLVALVARGDQVHVETLGTLATGGAPVARDSLFRIASTSKPITAAATLALAGEGLFDLDEPVDRLLPELAGRRVLTRMNGPLAETVPAERAITPRDLLTFTFGFGMVLEMFTTPGPWPVVAEADRLRLATIGPPQPAVQPDPDTWIAALGSLPLLAQPGERWLYNTGASVLGVLAARAAGQPFAEVLRTRVFEPLGMKDTAFWAADGGAPVLSADAARAMATDQLTPAQKARGGLGQDFFNGQSWGFGQAVLDSGAFGWAGGLGTTWMADPARDLTVIVLTQRQFESPETPAAHSEIQAAAYAALA